VVLTQHIMTRWDQGHWTGVHTETYPPATASVPPGHSLLSSGEQPWRPSPSHTPRHAAGWVMPTTCPAHAHSRHMRKEQMHVSKGQMHSQTCKQVLEFTSRGRS
jgi:hypothetical protein